MSVLLWKSVVEIADKVCKKYSLSYGKLTPEVDKRARRLGYCLPCDRCMNSEVIDEVNCREKLIYIRVHQLKDPNKPLAPSTILRTLAHELSHLREWVHGEDHREFEREIVEYIKELGYSVK